MEGEWLAGDSILTGNDNNDYISVIAGLGRYTAAAICLPITATRHAEFGLDQLV